MLIFMLILSVLHFCLSMMCVCTSSERCHKMIGGLSKFCSYAVNRTFIVKFSTFTQD